jgi:hypothetical protein
LRGAILWTINDYPAYGLVSGQAIHGYKACVRCGPRTLSRRSKNLSKNIFVRNRVWLPMSHDFRRKSSCFDGTLETDGAPEALSWEEKLRFGKETVEWLKQNPKADDNDKDNPACCHGVKRVAALSQLPYWKVC